MGIPPSRKKCEKWKSIIATDGLLGETAPDVTLIHHLIPFSAVKATEDRHRALSATAQREEASKNPRSLLYCAATRVHKQYQLASPGDAVVDRSEDQEAALESRLNVEGGAEKPFAAIFCAIISRASWFPLAAPAAACTRSIRSPSPQSCTAAAICRARQCRTDSIASRRG